MYSTKFPCLLDAVGACNPLLCPFHVLRPAELTALLFGYPMMIGGLASGNAVGGLVSAHPSLRPAPKPLDPAAPGPAGTTGTGKPAAVSGGVSVASHAGLFLLDRDGVFLAWA